MNWKVNYWTILFAVVTIGCLVITCTAKDTDEKSKQVLITSPAQECDGVKLDTITWGEGVIRFLEYAIYADYLKDRTPGDTSSWNISNPDVLYFHLPRCELNEMLRRRPNGDIYAALSIELDPKETGKSRIDLLFSDQVPPKRDSPEVTEGDDDAAVFFDFTNPCPTSCPPYN